ncbi:unnamed protein product [Mytilus coruscus]|uniref:Leucine-rich repeat-containing protein 14 n=1 Tax=Mytilus coruscus TaxID=42192 RepID=A0A6J8B5H7_MYTCO|nr:unnamed protein product [Mytilus coruscus]
MDTSLWYEYYQGVVYPLDLCSPPAIGQQKKSVASLTTLCSRYIIQDSTMTAQAIHYIPKELCIVLMQEALICNKDRAVDVLLSHWPFETLSLQKLVPNVFTSVRPLYDMLYLSEVTRQCLRYTTCLAHTFLECVKNKTPTKLRYLDMSGFPTPEVILYYLATHCMLSYNEARQNVMVNMYNKAVQLLPQPVPDRLMMADQFLPDTSILVKLDAFVAADQTLTELSKALKVSGFTDSKLCMCLQKLDATCLGEPKLNILLGQINPQYLTGIRLKYNSINCESFCNLAPTLEKFTNLCALDLSCNSITVYQSDSTTEVLGKTLSSLPNLSRLDLSSNRLKYKLRQLISGTQQPLQHLRLAGCGLTESDIRYLSTSHHTKALQHIDLSGNTLTLCCGSLGRLLEEVKSTLLVLELEDSKLDDGGILRLLPYISLLHSILYLNLSQNSLVSSVCLQLSVTLSALVDLKALKISYCSDFYGTEDEEEFNRVKQMFVNQFLVVLNKLSETHLVMSDLESI